MKAMKKINPAILQRLAPGLILLAFVYGFYYLFGVYRDYRGEREIKPGKETAGVVENQNENEDLPVTPPSFHTIPPDGNATLDIFSFKERKSSGADSAGGEKDKPSDYTILGVVKKDRLYLAVRTQADNKIRLIPEGAAINDNYRIKKLEPFSVVVIDSEGLSRTYKIFQSQEIKEIHDNEKTN
ncbi:MAG: hypothetical protein NT166_29030 [Candidatus Aminicenantes bacterium]|nr:hypothetical protein [Candidatus Aminicenantes bacterium]